MREYAKVSPLFWTGETGRALREKGHEAMLVALYLLTCPSSNMIGLYYLPLTTLAHETGLTLEGATKGLRWASEAQFAFHDAPSEVIWVPEMARWQIAAELKPGDKQIKGVLRELSQYEKSKFFTQFRERYDSAFNLTSKASGTPKKQAPQEALGRPLEGPPKPRAGAGTGTITSRASSDSEGSENPEQPTAESTPDSRPGAGGASTDSQTLREPNSNLDSIQEPIPNLKVPNVSCSTIEEYFSVDPKEAVLILQTEAKKAGFWSSVPAVQRDFGNAIREINHAGNPQPITIDDIHLLARWMVEAETDKGKGGLAWMDRKKPDLPYLSKPEVLEKHIAEAREWQAGSMASSQSPQPKTRYWQPPLVNEHPPLTPEQLAECKRIGVARGEARLAEIRRSTQEEERQWDKRKLGSPKRSEAIVSSLSPEQAEARRKMLRDQAAALVKAEKREAERAASEQGAKVIEFPTKKVDD